MRIWRIEFDDSYYHMFEWFGTKKEATKRWAEVKEEAKKAKLNHDVYWGLREPPHLVEIPDRKGDLVPWLNTYLNNADGI